MFYSWDFRVPNFELIYIATGSGTGEHERNLFRTDSSSFHIPCYNLRRSNHNILTKKKGIIIYLHLGSTEILLKFYVIYMVFKVKPPRRVILSIIGSEIMDLPEGSITVYLFTFNQNPLWTSAGKVT